MLSPSAKLIHESAESLLYFQEMSEFDDTLVVIKMLRHEFPEPTEVDKLTNDYEITRRLTHVQGIRKAYKLTRINNRYALYLDYFAGQTLQKRFELPSSSIFLDFLELAVKITEIVSNIHQQNVVHCNLNPFNILVGKYENDIQIIDFGFASKVNKTGAINHAGRANTSLAYIAPEQTGRTDQKIAFGADLYALGATFYAILTGKPPFLDQERMSLIHAHIARNPIAPTEIKDEIPSILSDIILKLLQKNPENRYKTAYGLQADLQRCLVSLEATGTIENFELGQDDISDEFRIPDRLYGREKEIRVLNKTFESVCKGNKELVILAGEPGVGKSRLMQRIRKMVVEQNGYYSAGKFDKLHRDVPYSAWVQIFRSLTDEILRESGESVANWKTKLHQQLGEDVAIITEVVPNLRFLLDTPEALEKSRLFAESARNRVQQTFRKFIETIARKEHPFVAFIDEFQWADTASLELFQSLMLGNEKYFLVIGAYRQSAVEAEHPFQKIMDQLHAQSLRLKTLSLGNLDMQAVGDIICDTLHCTPEYARPLIELVYAKTQGNAFFVHQFLTSLYEENLLTFRREAQPSPGEKYAGRGIWVWDISQIQDLNITDNVVELMANKIQKLDPTARQVLEFAACIGNRFDLKTLTEIYGKPKEETIKSIEDALKMGLIFENNRYYKFAHVRIHQAVYMQMDEQKRRKLHLNIGQLLKNIYAARIKRKGSKRIFDIVNQLNQGKDFIDHQADKLELAELNLQAGETAKATQAYETAQIYLQTGLSLLPENAWDSHHQLTFELHKAHASATYLIGKYQESEVEISQMIHKVNNAIEKAEAYYVLLVQYIARGKYQKALNVGKEALACLGEKLPENQLHELIQKEKENIDAILESRSIESLHELPKLTDTHQKIRVKILVNMLTISHLLGEVAYHAYLTTLVVQTCIKYGNLSLASLGYGNYANVLASQFDEVDKGQRFIKLACQLSDEANNSFLIAANYTIMANYVNPWKEHLKNSKFLNDKAHAAAQESGNMPYVAFTRLLKVVRQYYQGTNLNKILTGLPETLALAEKYEHYWIADGVRAFDLAINNLAGKTEDKDSFKTPDIDEAQFLEKAQNSYSLSSIAYFQLLKASIHYLYGDYGTALRFVMQTEKLSHTMQGLFILADLYFYQSLILAALYADVSAELQAKYQAKIQENLEKLKIYTKNAPENYAHRYYLVKAELARITQDIEVAMDYYDKAIASAEENEFVQVKALANELAGKFWLAKNKPQFGTLYLKNAHFEYQTWGAIRKVQELEDKYTSHLRKVSARAKDGLEENKYTENSSSLDLFSIIKASQALAGEIVLAKALEKVIEIIIENAGAQRGLLVLPKENDWFVEAEACSDSSATNVLQSIPLHQVDGYTNEPLLSSEIVNYVIRTQKRLLLNDISNRGAFTGLHYVRKVQPKSVLCMPLFNQGKVGGILYLENRLITGAFTSDRLQVLKMLSSQILISIQNATLYENLEEKVKERTAELGLKNQRMAMQALKLQAINDKLDGANNELNTKNKAVTASINYAKRIQEAMLPQISELENAFSEAFVFFEPRDIVSGDFYWFTQKENKTIIAAIDCTGHGVPGAFMSLIGNDLLNEIVNLLGITNADEILNRLHTEITQALKQPETANRDGMDMSLCVINKQEECIEFAGAKNPLVIVKNGVLTEIMGDKFSIGGVRKIEQLQRHFTRHRVSFDPTTTYYLFSDGYQDQFGGSEARKFMKKRFKSLLLEISKYPLAEQKYLLAEHFAQWIEGHRQIDDVMVIGFRV